MKRTQNYTVVDDTLAEDPHEYTVGETVTLTGETAEHFGVLRFRTTDKIWVSAWDLDPQPQTGWRDVRRKKAQVGDWAFHKDGLDPREVTQIDHEAGVLWIYILTGPFGPVPIKNYTFRREVAL